MAGSPKLHRYVPQFLLRPFSTGRNHLINVLDKRDVRVFLSAFNKVAAQRSFYDVPADITRKIVERGRAEGFDVSPFAEDLVIPFEPGSGRIESNAARVVQKIVRDESLAGLSDWDRTILALFATLQYLRAAAARDLRADYRRGTTENRPVG